LQFDGPVSRIVSMAVLATLAVSAQTAKPSAQRKSEAAAKTASHAAQVTYTGGQLSVVANNTSLAETLAEIRDLTKAKIEGVQPGVAERISGEFGPDTPRAVVGALLAASHYNFILVSTPGSPGSLQRIVLSEPAPEAVAATQPRPTPTVRPDPPAEAAAQAKAPVDGGIPTEMNPQGDGGAKDEPRHGASGVVGPADPAAGADDAKETKSESDINLPATEPNHAKSDNQPTLPPTVEICGVKYDASQLENVKVPDHCGKTTQQPNSPNGSK
jgi:hypothetical protein